MDLRCVEAKCHGCGVDDCLIGGGDDGGGGGGNCRFEVQMELVVGLR